MPTLSTLILGLMAIAQAAPLPHLGTIDEGLLSPVRMAVANDESLLVTDPVGRRVVRFDATGQLVGSWSVPEAPIGIAVHPDGRIFVSYRDDPGVAIYDANMVFQGRLGAGDPEVDFVRPTDIDIASDTGRIYVVDAEASRIYVFHNNGSLAASIGTTGNLEGQFLYPSAIAVDEPRHRIVVADHDNYRLQVFSTQGAFQFAFGGRLEHGTYGQGFTPRTQGLAIDDLGRIYVSDALMGTVRAFDSSGEDLGVVVEYGLVPGTLRNPCGLALTPDATKLYVGNVGNGCVEVFSTQLTGGVASALPAGRPKATRLPVTYSRLAQGVRNGPHLDHDRLNLCQPCHGINGQPGGNGGSVEGQAALCVSCHNAGGRALALFVHHNEVADPYGTNAGADGKGNTHAWGVPAVQEGHDWTRPGPALSAYLGPGDEIKCATCHNQHDTETFFPYLRMTNDGDAMCKQCHLARVKDVGEPGSHPVGVLYPSGEDEYPSRDALRPLQIKDDRVECMTCHGVHNADSGGANGGAGDGMLLRQANDETLCLACHTEHAIHGTNTEWQPTCRDCHDVHDVGSTNSALVARHVDGVAVTFLAPDPIEGGIADYVHGDSAYDGICEVCHTATAYHRHGAEGDHQHYTSLACTACHLHRDGFAPMDDYCTLCHQEPPGGDTAPNRAGAHDVHMSLDRGPRIETCETCHKAQTDATHDDGVVDFASGPDINGDGTISLVETSVCDECHSPEGEFDGVNDAVIGAKANWYAPVYDGSKLSEDKADWCLGCHDSQGAVVHDVVAPTLAGDNRTWGYNIGGHGASHVLCTDCHDPLMVHQDGVAKTFSLRFPLCPEGLCPPSDRRERDRKAYNAAYRLRRVGGKRALELPRDESQDPPDDFRLCLICHNKYDLLGVPIGYQFSPGAPPRQLMRPEGTTAQTDFRNEQPWGMGYNGQPANIHWQHLATQTHPWDMDQDGVPEDSAASCTTCHNPHGTQRADGTPTIAMTVRDLNISHGVYDDGTTRHEYGYIGGGGFLVPGGDLHCSPCHRRHGPGPDPPSAWAPYYPRYYRKPITEWPRQCDECHAE